MKNDMYGSLNCILFNHFKSIIRYDKETGG